MPREEREAVRSHMFAAQMALGWCFPNAILQYALADIDALSSDIASLSAKRNRMVGVLEKSGYELLRPEGTFYIFCKCPGGDPERFWNFLAGRDVFVVPGSTMGAPGHFRICLTASMEMVERSLPIFAEAIEIMRN
jgi:aspartate aminotransferase